MAAKAKEKDKDEARAQGYQRGLDGKSSAAGITQGWTDDKGSGPARTEGFIEGKKKRARNQEAEKTARGKK
jgi:hypothetical protein